MDADDAMLPHRVRRQLDAALETPRVYLPSVLVYVCIYAYVFVYVSAGTSQQCNIFEIYRLRKACLFVHMHM